MKVILVLCVLLAATAVVSGALLRYTGVNQAGAEFDTNPWQYPAPASYQHLQAIGMNIFRVPFKWERLQPTAGGAFDNTEQTRLVNSITDITKNGAYAIVDPHNYARYYGGVIGSGGPSNDQFKAFWQTLAGLFKNNPRVIFGVMNEPHDMSTEQWLSASNAGIQGIRASGATQLILVPGNGYTGAHSWTGNWYGTPNANVMSGTVDSGNNYAFEVHQYFDGDYSGTNDYCKSATVGSEVMPPLTSWARSRGYKLFLGEFGSGKSATCEACIRDVLTYMESNSDVYIGFTWWSAGPNWPNDYFTLIEPVNGQDRVQTQWLFPHLSGPRTENITAIYGGGSTGGGGNGGNAGQTNTAAVYTDGVQGTWSTSSTWAATWNGAYTGQYTYPNPNSGRSISWVPNGYDAIYFTCTPDAAATCFDNRYASISFYVNGGASGGGVQLRVQLRDASKNPTGNGVAFTTQANTWVQQTIPISSFGASGPYTGFTIQEHVGRNTGVTVYIDDVYVNQNAASSNNPSTTNTATRAAAVASSTTNTATASRTTAASFSSTNTATASRSTAASLTSTNTATRSVGASLTNTATASRTSVATATSTATATRGTNPSTTRTAGASMTRAASVSRLPGNSAVPSPTTAPLTQAIYVDTLMNNWQFATQPNQFNQQASSPTYANSAASISYAPTGSASDKLPFACFNSVCLNPSSSYGIQFQANAGSGSGQTFTIQLTQGGNLVGSAVEFTVRPSGWKQFQFAYSQFGSLPSGQLNGFTIQGRVGSAQPATFFDSIYVIGGTVAAQVAFVNNKRGDSDFSNNTADAMGLSRDQSYTVDGQTVGLVGLTEEQMAAAEDVASWLPNFNDAQGSSYSNEQVTVTRMAPEVEESSAMGTTSAANTLRGIMNIFL